MKIHFSLGWVSKGLPASKSFKSQATYALMDEYVSRISKFTPCAMSRSLEKRPAGGKLWICDRTKEAKTFSSEDLAEAVQKLCDSGVRDLHIAIGGSEGFTAEQLRTLSPDLRWSFGPMTLPHELAAVVGAEQIYRAYSILQGLPYHLGH